MMRFAVFAIVILFSAVAAAAPASVPAELCDKYTPGVDVRGDAVAPADLPPEEGGQVDIMPEQIQFHITVDVARYLGIANPRGLIGEAEIGTVTLIDDDVYYNGELLNQGANERIQAACARQADKKEEEEAGDASQ